MAGPVQSHFKNILRVFLWHSTTSSANVESDQNTARNNPKHKRQSIASSKQIQSPYKAKIKNQSKVLAKPIQDCLKSIEMSVQIESEPSDNKNQI